MSSELPTDGAIAVECRFCAAPAVAVYAMDRGCACYPEDREQSLCIQHIVSATPRGKMELKGVLDHAAYTWFLEMQKRWA
jgi:hypothetical protein